MRQILKLINIKNKPTVLEFSFHSTYSMYPLPFMGYFTWIYTFIHIFNSVGAPEYTRGLIQGSLTGRDILIAIQFSEFWETLNIGNENIYNFKIVYTHKHQKPELGKYFVGKCMKRLIKQHPSLDFYGDTRYYIRELKIIIPKK